MIQLATDPTASRMSYRPVQSGDAKQAAPESRRGRPGHAWPFLSRYAAQPLQDSQKRTGGNSAS